MDKNKINANTVLRERARQLLHSGKLEGDALFTADHAGEMDAESLHHLFEEVNIYLAELEVQKQELIESNNRLEEALEDNASLMALSPLPMLIVDDKGSIIRSNEQAHTLFYGNQRGPGAFPNILVRLQNPSPFIQLLESVKIDPSVSHSTRLALKSIKKLPAREIEVYARGYFSLDAAKPVQAPHILLSILDITDRIEKQRLEKQELQWQLEKQRLFAEKDAEIARQKSLLKDRFLANMSHEIRTPMNGVFGMLQLLEDAPLNDKYREFLLNALDNTRSLMRVVNDILDVSKINAGQLSLEKKPFQLSHLIEEVLLKYQSPAQKGNILLMTDLQLPEQSSGWFVGDALRIRQVLENLMSNAIKFTSNGEVHIVVDCQKHSANQARLDFSVKDTGIGMTQEQLAVVFEPFTQADLSTTRLFGGTGLGLTISRELVELMGGEIQAESRYGVGSVFSFSVPVVQSEPVTSAAVDGVNETRQFEGEALIVEDNPSNQVVIKALLAKMGFKTALAENGRQAVEMADKRAYDVIFMDFQMPVMDGIEAAQTIRRNEMLSGNPRQVIIAMTADAMSGKRDEAIEAGMDDYISKPVDFQDLNKVLAKWLVDKVVL